MSVPVVVADLPFLAEQRAELEQLEEQARTITHACNSTVAGCQRLLRETAAILERLPRPVGPLAAMHYRSAADLLDAMRMP